MKKLSILLIGIVFLLSCSENFKVPVYKNANLDIDTRVNDLLSRMTLEGESQANGYVLCG